METEQQLAEYEKSLGLPAGFIKALEKEGDDWSFTIKAHALVETGITELILHSIAKPELDELLAKLPITGQFSKLAICRELKLFRDDGETEQFTRELGTIRNRLVHNIKRVDFSLTDYFGRLQSDKPSEFQQQRKALDLLFAEEDSLTLDGKTITTADLFKANARQLIAASLGMVLARVHVVTDAAKWKRDVQEQGAQLYDTLLRAEFARTYASKAPEVQPQSK